MKELALLVTLMMVIYCYVTSRFAEASLCHAPSDPALLRYVPRPRSAFLAPDSSESRYNVQYLRRYQSTISTVGDS